MHRQKNQHVPIVSFRLLFNLNFRVGEQKIRYIWIVFNSLFKLKFYIELGIKVTLLTLH